MIDLIKPPTDNLYKFAAIFGLVLIVVGFVFPPWLFYRSSLELLKSFAGQDELEVYQKFAADRNWVFDERKMQVAAEQAKLQQRLDALVQSQSASVSREIDKLRSEERRGGKE